MTRSLKDQKKPSAAAGDEAQIMDVVNQFSGKSESELFDVLRSETVKERAAGNLDNTRMDDIYEKLYPMLTDAQRAKMQQVITRLKE